MSLQAPTDDSEIKVTVIGAAEEEASLDVAQICRAHVSMCECSALFYLLAPQVMDDPSQTFGSLPLSFRMSHGARGAGSLPES